MREIRFTDHARKQFKKRFFQMHQLAWNPDGLLRKLLESGEIKPYRGQKAIINGPLIAPIRRSPDGHNLVLTILREI